MPQPEFKIGSITVHFYGIFISLGLIFWYLYLKSILKRTSESLYLDSIVMISLVSALIGARTYHVLSSFSYYRIYPAEILYFWQGGLGIFGAILGGFLGTLAYCKYKKIGITPYLNAAFPPLLMAQAIGRIGNFFNNEGFWQESIFCFIAFILYLLILKKFDSKKFGFSYYLISYGLIRFFTEFIRTDTWVIFGFHLAHLLSIIFIVCGFFLLTIVFKRIK